jgi:ribonuclease HI
MSQLLIFTDGGARKNPGPAALGVYIEQDGKPLAKIGKYLGEKTNNFAEYSAILTGLEWVLENKNKLKVDKIEFYTDSLLAYSQITGLYKVKNAKIRDFIFKIRKIEQELKLPIFYHHVPREKNKIADFLVNQTLDNR